MTLSLRMGPIALAIIALWYGGAHAQAAAPAATTLDDVEVRASANGIGTSDAASAGVVSGTALQARPLLRPAEVLESVPGMIVTQHSGDGKANQYFLRGFNLDHGTDFATWVDGMPANMVSHAHGQGYTDINWLLPELVDRIGYGKGPYYAQEGDFSSAGAAHISLVDALARPLAQVTGGERGYARALLAASSALPAGHLLYAFEAARNDGPWRHPEKYHRINAVLRYSVAEGASRWSLTGLAYSSGWDATDQIPQRAVAGGSLDRFGTMDASDGGSTARYSLSWGWQRQLEGGEIRATAYAVRSRLDLFSDFTYFLDHPAAGDQFAQSERRTLAGGSVSRRWTTPVGDRDSTTELGLQLRQDRLDPVGLYDSVARERVATVQESRVTEASAGLYASNDTQWLPWLRTVAGLRMDRFHFDVASSIPANSGKRAAGVASPKLSVILGPWARTEFFVNAGSGFHSNDARGTVAQVTAREQLPTSPVTPLVRSAGAEVGARTELVPNVQSSIALWTLRLGSELVFSGDAGDTQASRASRRSGIEWNTHWRVTPWLSLDADLAWSRARFTQDDPAGNFVPGAAGKVASVAATIAQSGPWSGQLQVRHFGPRPLVEDNSRRSASTTLASLRVGYRFSERTSLAVDVFNLFDRKANDIEYFYASRLPGEPVGGVNDRHFHPVEPRTLRVTLTSRF